MTVKQLKFRAKYWKVFRFFSRIKCNFYFMRMQIKYKVIGLYRELDNEEKIAVALCTKEGRRLLGEAMVQPIRSAIFYGRLSI